MENSECFEDLLQIWEFGNTFSGYLELPPFKIEELHIALACKDEIEVGLITDLMTAILERMIEEPQEDEDQLLKIVQEFNDDKIDFIWTEVTRIVIKSNIY